MYEMAKTYFFLIAVPASDSFDKLNSTLENVSS